jgi:hypothetical protein
VTLLQPDGYLLLTNLHVQNPHRSFMEYLGDWFVIYRSLEEFGTMVIGDPARLTTEELITDETGTNIYFAGRPFCSDRPEGR